MLQKLEDELAFMKREKKMLSDENDFENGYNQGYREALSLAISLIKHDTKLKEKV